jgi:hypothetical protein
MYPPALTSALADLALPRQQAVHGPDGAVVDPFIQEGGIYLRRGLIHKTLSVQERQHHLLFLARQGERRCRPLALTTRSFQA